MQTLINVAFRRTCYTFAWLMIALVTFIVLRIAVAALPAMHDYGWGFLREESGTRTPHVRNSAEIWGTLYTSILALVLGTAFGAASAIFLSEGYLGKVTIQRP